MIFTEAEVLRQGNELLLNNLKEGVVILEEENQVVAFVNESAKNLKVQANVEFEITLSNENNKFDRNAKSFARVDPKMLRVGDDTELAESI